MSKRKKPPTKVMISIGDGPPRHPADMSWEEREQARRIIDAELAALDAETP